MKRLLIASLLLLSWSRLYANPSQIARCRAFMEQNPDLVCTGIEASQATERLLAQLDHDLTLARSSRKRWGFTVGTGLGLAGVVDQNFTTRVTPAGIFGFLYGFHF